MMVSSMRETYNTNIPWIGKIPIEWKFTKLGRLTCIITDGTHQTPNYIETGYPFLSIKDISSGKIDFSDVKYISEDEHKSLYQHAPVKRGDFLFTRIGTLGIFVEVNTDEIFDFFVSVGMFRLKENVINHHFLLHYLNSPAVENYIQAIKAGFGTAAPKYNLADVKRTWIIVPPEKEQERIANFLDAKCGEIDALSDEIQSEIDTLEEYKRSVITEAVTKGLDKTVPMKDSGIQWIGKIPAHWHTYRIADLYEERNERGNDSLPLLSVSINSGVSDKELTNEEQERVFLRSEDKTKYKQVYPGDITYNLMRAWQGAFGAVRVHGMVSPAYAVGKPKANVQIDSRYIEAIIRSPMGIEEMNRYSYGIMDFRKRLYWPQFRIIRICLPELSEQKVIADYIDIKTTEINDIISQKREQLSVLTDYKKSLIYEYVTGKKEVSAS